MKEKKGEKMIKGIMLLICSMLFFIYFGYAVGKKASQKEKQMKPLGWKDWNWNWTGLTCTFILFIMGIWWFIFAESYEKGELSTMWQRLNEPVISEAQLYGYEIVGKHMEEYGSSDDISYFIDIKDRLAEEKILKHVKTSQELYEKVKIGNSFDYTLMGKLKVPELKTPIPEDL